MKIVSHQLASADVAGYFLATLELGGDLATDHFRTVMDSGDFFALAPEGESIGRLRQFSTGGLLEFGERRESGSFVLRNVPNLADAMAATILDYAEKIDNPIVLLHEPYLQINDASEITRELSVIGSALYKAIALDTSPDIDLAQQIRRFSVSWHALFILSASQNRIDLKEIIENAVLIGVGAYDGESYIYWSKRHQPP